MEAQLSQETIQRIVDSQAQLGLSHVCIACPFNASSDYPSPPPDAIAYMKGWIDAIRAAGLNVFFRPTDIFYEGIFDASQCYPESSSGIPTGNAAEVLQGTDTSSYLFRMYSFIMNHQSLFADGDLWGPFPEPENVGIGSDLTTHMFTSVSALGQWLVDIQTVSDSAFAAIGCGGVVTGMTSVNAGTARAGSIDTSYWTQIGRCCIDLYWPYGDYGPFLDAVYDNAQVDVYLNEWGTLVSEEATTDISQRFDWMVKYFALFAGKTYLKGINYFQSAGYSNQEDIMNSTTFELLPQARVIEKYFREMPRILV